MNENLKRKSAYELVTLRVSGMDCADEIKAIRTALDREGISRVEANLMAATVKIEFTNPWNRSDIERFVEEAGVKVIAGDYGANANDGIPKSRIILVAVSGAAVALTIALEKLTAQSFMPIAASVVAVWCGGVLIFPKALRALKRAQLDMNVLMTVATAGAFAIGEFSEAATVVFLFALSELLEAFSVARARRAIREVLDITPNTATVINSDGKASSQLVAEIEIGTVLRVKPGERIPLDGSVRRGSSAVNQAPLTGESVPVSKGVGDPVFGGTINESNVLDIEVTASLTDSKVSRIIRMIEEAQQAKAPSERFVDRFAKIYTPVVFIIAIVTVVVPPLFLGQSWDTWIYRSLVLLVVACPCALVLATPVSIVSGLTAMARRGVLVKGGAALEALGTLRAIAVDKTGTITEGQPRVQKVVCFGKTDERTLLSIAAGAESLSTHPLAKAVVRFAEENRIDPQKADAFENIVGKGAKATVGGEKYFFGNHRFAHELGACNPEIEATLAELEAAALSMIVVGKAAGGAGSAIGVIGLGDAVRSNAKAALSDLHRAGIEEVVMLSGDNQKTAEAIAKQAGIDRAVGNLLPDDKVTHIRDLLTKRSKVGMIGDGINDAPALALATVGIAMGAAGSDTAIETADVALMRDDLAQVAVAVVQGRRAVGVIKFNIAFALAIKLIFLILAMFGVANLWFAVLADTGASLLVIGNALRLLKAD